MIAAPRDAHPIDLPLLAESPPLSPLMVCGLCGQSYGESARTGCSSCPMNDACLMTCCPSCGYTAPDPRNSKLLSAARALGRFAARGRKRAR